jgi:hypothetical protein
VNRRLSDLVTRWPVTVTYLLFCMAVVVGVLLLEVRR